MIIKMHVIRNIFLLDNENLVQSFVSFYDDFEATIIKY